MIIALFYLTDVRYGGFVSYTTHLVHALAATGHAPMLFKVGARSEQKHRPFADGVAYRNVSLDEAVAIARSVRSLVTCAYWKSHGESLGPLLDVGAGLVLHDPTELQKGLAERVAHANTRVVAIRRANLAAFQAHGLDARFAQHPYVAHTPSWREPLVARPIAAVSLSRVDFDKNTTMLARANELLPEGYRIRIHGAVNTMYEHHKIKPAHPTWRDNYCGTFPRERGEAVRIASAARRVVDLSVIKGDGDGTQYTFLEAWDSGAELVVHADWIKRGDDAVRPGETARVVSSAEELTDVVAREPSERIAAAGRELLDNHAPWRSIPALFASLGWS